MTSYLEVPTQGQLLSIKSRGKPKQPRILDTRSEQTEELVDTRGVTANDTRKGSKEELADARKNETAETTEELAGENTSHTPRGILGSGGSSRVTTTHA